MAQPDGSISAVSLAQLLMLTPRHLSRLVGEGWIQKSATGRYSLVSGVQGYVRYLRDETRRNSKSGAVQKREDAKTREIEQRIAQRDRKLIAVEECFAVVDKVIGTFRAAQDGLGAEFTRDMGERNRLEGLLNGTYTRAQAELAKSIALIEAGGSLDVAPADDDPGPVGGKE